MNAHMFDISFVFVIFDILKLGGRLSALLKPNCLFFRDTFDLHLNSCLCDFYEGVIHHYGHSLYGNSFFFLCPFSLCSFCLVLFWGFCFVLNTGPRQT